MTGHSSLEGDRSGKQKGFTLEVPFVQRKVHGSLDLWVGAGFEVSLFCPPFPTRPVPNRPTPTKAHPLLNQSGFQARSKDLEILEEGGGAGPSTLPRRDRE